MLSALPLPSLSVILIFGCVIDHVAALNRYNSTVDQREIVCGKITPTMISLADPLRAVSMLMGHN